MYVFTSNSIDIGLLVTVEFQRKAADDCNNDLKCLTPYHNNKFELNAPRRIGDGIVYNTFPLVIPRPITLSLRFRNDTKRNTKVSVTIVARPLRDTS
jgi:hypothetical protein